MRESDISTDSIYSEPINSVEAIQVNANTFAIQPAYQPSFDLPKLIALIQDLGSSNVSLLQQATELKQALTECQESLRSNKQQSLSAETMLSQQNQDITDAQEQIKCLSEELAATHQTTQKQQTIIESLTAHLESSQERVAQLERECSLVQAKYNEQSYQLAQTQENCQELRNRLQRQQQHNLQLKVALEKSMETSVSSSHSACFNVQPIEPWSTQPQFSDEESNCVGNFRSEFPKRGISKMDLSWEEQLDVAMHVVLEPSVSPPAESEVSTDFTEVYFPTQEVNEQENWQNLADLLASMDEPITARSPRTKLDSSSTPQTQWPSPLVNPSHPPKGRKSLAAIELPTFKRG